MEDKDLELRKFALTAAMGFYANKPEVPSVEYTREIYAFLKGEVSWGSTEVTKDDKNEEAGVTAVSPPWNETELHVRPFKLAPLTAVQKVALKTAIELYRDTGRVTGSDIGRIMNYARPGALNMVFRKLHNMGYVRRKGWFITPVYNAEGVAVAPVVQKLPDGVAMGYRPMRAKLGEVGRIG